MAAAGVAALFLCLPFAYQGSSLARSVHACPRRYPACVRARPSLGLFDALDDIREYIDQLGGYDESFSELQLKGEAELKAPEGPREVDKGTIDVFLVGLIIFPVVILLYVGAQIEATHPYLFK